MIEIDLNARVLGEEHNVFVARPGKGYRLYREFRENSSLILELPGLKLEPGVPLDDQELRRRVNRSRAFRAWYNRGQPSDDRPSRDLSNYSPEAGGNSAAQLEGLVRTYYEKIRRGDLVIVPPKAYMEEALIGEVRHAGTRYDTEKVPRLFGNEDLPARSVRWLARIPKTDLPFAILDALQKPNAAFIVERSLRGQFYKLAYGNYSIDDLYSGRFEVTSADFDTFDDALLQAFFNFTAANTRAVAQDRDADVKGFVDAAFIDSGEYTAQLQTNINSPGFISLIGRKITPLVASALLVIAVEIGPAAVQEIERGNIVLRNSKASAADTCTAEVERQAFRQIQLLGLDEWPAACDKAREVARRTGLKSPATVKRD
ncbi:hypothetical protein [Bradyrhizobium sp. DASA03007]|uniref:hypothetical protein n=1 Tax=unclassified Bradyrhizobium TaxID=2631580 RepID=UPI003F71B5D0